MTILDNMPRDGNCTGHVLIGDPNAAPNSLSYATVPPPGAPAMPAGTAAMPPGVTSVRCFMHGFDTVIVSQNSQLHRGYGTDSHNLYWLPWGNGVVASATWGALNGSSLFLTSTFSGCRFVVNAHGVAHVAWGGHPGGIGTPASRDGAEVAAGTGNPAAGAIRRTLSMTNVVPGPHEQRITYNATGAGGGPEERCVVVGWRVGTVWTFKCLIMKIGQRMRSKWKTLATVNVGGGNVVIN